MRLHHALASTTATQHLYPGTRFPLRLFLKFCRQSQLTHPHEVYHNFMPADWHSAILWSDISASTSGQCTKSTTVRLGKHRLLFFDFPRNSSLTIELSHLSNPWSSVRVCKLGGVVSTSRCALPSPGLNTSHKAVVSIRKSTLVSSVCSAMSL